MFDYLLSQAQKAGLQARKTNDGVVITFRFYIPGKMDIKQEITVHNYTEFKALMGEEI